MPIETKGLTNPVKVIHYSEAVIFFHPGPDKLVSVCPVPVGAPET
jgi:hypothetical protein